MIKLYQNRAHM